MANFCCGSPRLRTDTGSARAVADYLAGYGEALADRGADQPERLADD
ncbi:hypothetical protein [Mycolicibacterium diernhoferi]|nr:hypothetical protein [Mycolicibacterium diernhoferi]QYL25168.1 hypothetical protein K0O62_13525 [Mycolicibacterium diernhoferi]